MKISKSCLGVEREGASEGATEGSQRKRGGRKEGGFMIRRLEVPECEGEEKLLKMRGRGRKQRRGIGDDEMPENFKGVNEGGTIPTRKNSKGLEDFHEGKGKIWPASRVGTFSHFYPGPAGETYTGERRGGKRKFRKQGQQTVHSRLHF